MFQAQAIHASDQFALSTSLWFSVVPNHDHNVQHSRSQALLLLLLLLLLLRASWQPLLLVQGGVKYTESEDLNTVGRLDLCMPSTAEMETLL